MTESKTSLSLDNVTTDISSLYDKVDSESESDLDADTPAAEATRDHQKSLPKARKHQKPKQKRSIEQVKHRNLPQKLKRKR